MCSWIFSISKQILNLYGQLMLALDLSHNEEVPSWKALEFHDF